VLVGAAIAAVLAGPPGPTVAPPTPGGAKFVFEPKQLTIVVTAWWPPPWTWPETSKPIHIRGRGTPDYNHPTTHLSSGDGGQLVAKLKVPDTNQAAPIAAQVGITAIGTAGEYTGVLSLDPIAAEAATLDLTVKARHAFVWPLLVLLLGALLSYGGRLALGTTRDRASTSSCCCLLRLRSCSRSTLRPTLALGSST
jgi:hypothetical protein